MDLSSWTLYAPSDRPPSPRRTQSGAHTLPVALSSRLMSTHKEITRDSGTSSAKLESRPPALTTDGIGTPERSLRVGGTPGSVALSFFHSV